MKKIIFFLIFIISFSCKQNRVPKPDKIISKDKMEDIMFDLAILNAARSSDSRILEENHIVPTKFLYKKHQIDSLELAQNSIYYAAQPKVYKEIIDAVDKRLVAMRDSLIKKEEITPMDSIIDFKEIKEALNHNQQ